MSFVLVTADPAQAVRSLPKNARFGTLSDFRYPYAVIDKRTLRMAPGGKIYNEQSLIIMPSAMRVGGGVLYQLDTRGDISGIWLLTTAEAARYRRPAPPAQTPSRD